MKKTAMVFSGIILVLGCSTLGISLILSAVLPHISLVYLTANPSDVNNIIFPPSMIRPYVFSAIEIVAGFIGMVVFGAKIKD